MSGVDPCTKLSAQSIDHRLYGAVRMNGTMYMKVPSTGSPLLLESCHSAIFSEWYTDMDRNVGRVSIADWIAQPV
jgi:hypothetical protein